MVMFTLLMTFMANRDITYMTRKNNMPPAADLEYKGSLSNEAEFIPADNRR